MILKTSIIIAMLGAAVSSITFMGYCVRYSKHEAKLGVIPYDKYLELTRMTQAEKYFLTVGSLSFLVATAVALLVVVGRSSLTEESLE